MSKHTPGPWTRTGSTNSDAQVEIHGRMNGSNPDLAPIVIATVVRAGDLGWGEGEANAALIAAAPELLESLKRMTERYGQGIENINGDTKAALAAIAKAEGSP